MKRIITCNDGTWNHPGTIDEGEGVMTNVEKIYKCIESIDSKGVEQVKFYDNGVGTSPGLYNKLRGGVEGWGIDKNIKDTYKFIMWNYSQTDDELYLFGFSRGAYTARSLAGFIRNCGILKPENLHLVDEAYELYRDRTILAHPDSDAMKSFRKQYSHNGGNPTRIKCVGVWDTVGALGIPLHMYQFANQERYMFHDVTLSSWVEYGFHAIAIDERRKMFTPTLWKKSKDFGDTNTLEQVWFSGVHANIGGGYKQTGLSNITLEWMMEKVAPLKLNFNRGLLEDDNAKLPRKLYIRPMMKGYKRDSIKDFWIYWFGPHPWRIIHYERQAEDPSKALLNMSGNKISSKNTNEFIHISVLRRLEDKVDEVVSPYLLNTVSYFTSNNLIDRTSEAKIDFNTVENK